MAITRIKNNQITDSTITNVKIVSGTLTGDKMHNNLTFNSNLVLNGNLTVTGNVTAVQSTTTQITDPLLTLGQGNAGTSYDLGMILIRGSGGNRFIGFKENEGAFVFINTTEDGLTIGNIATTTYSNVILGNAVALGSSRLGGITLSGNTISAAGAMTIRSDDGTITVANALVGTGAVSLGSTLSVFSTATVNALVSNGAIQGTTLSGSGNATVNALTVNNSATIGGTLGVVGAVLIGNTLGVNGATTVSSLTVNNAITAATGTILGNLLVEGNLRVMGNLSYINVDEFVVEDPIIQLNTGPNGSPLSSDNNFDVGIRAHYYDTADRSSFFGRTDSSGFFEYFSNVTGESGNVITGTLGTIRTGNLQLTGSGDFDGGLQSTPIGNASASTGAFTTITSTGTIIASGNIVANSGTASTGSTTGALVVIGGAGINGTLNVQTAANLGNVTFNNTTISSNLTNTGLTINPNGTGTTKFNSGLNASKTIIQGTSANTFVVTGTQIGINTATPHVGATMHFEANDSIILPAGSIGDRPASPYAGMFRFSTTSNVIEWYDGTAWKSATTDFTIVTANIQTGNGSTTAFTIPIANATTAGTIVSINGVVQEPVTAYSISGSTVTFTEAPAATDTIDFRVFVTTTQVTAVTDTAGNTGLFFDQPTIGSQITTFKTAGVERFSIQANGTSRFTGNVEPSANITYSLGSNTNRWKDLWLSGTTLYLGNIIVKETAGNTIAFYGPDGNTPATLSANGSSLIGVDATSITAGTSNVKVFSSSNIAVTVGGAANTVVFSSTAITHSGSILPSANGTANIGSTVLQYNTIHAKATSAQYADLAENYAADAEYEAGTVLEFGGVAEVTLSETVMSTRVAGVVSTNPAYLMNNSLTGIKAPIALQGRVPCKVVGPVRKGDMMVSAGNGAAQAATAPVIGSVIGKSLENFDGTLGVIEVAVGRV